MFRSAGETVADVFRLFLPFKNLNELKREIRSRSWTAARDDMSVTLDAAPGHISPFEILFKARIAGRALSAQQPETAKHIGRGTDRGHPFLRISRKFLQFSRENGILPEVFRSRPAARQHGISA